MKLIDVTDLLDRVARENMRTGGDVEIVVEADGGHRHDLGLAWRAAAGGRQPGAQRGDARGCDANRVGG